MLPEGAGMSHSNVAGTPRLARRVRSQPWREHLRRIGFKNSADADWMGADLFGTRVLADPLPEGGFELLMQRQDPRTVLLPGGPRLPGGLDELQIREEVWNQVRRTLPTERSADLAAALRPDLATATHRALAALDAGTYRRFIDVQALAAHGSHYRYGTSTSAERTSAEVTAVQTRDPDVSARLASEHPDPEIRAMAAANPACPAAVLLRCAENELVGVVRRALLAQSSRSTGLTEVLTLNTLTRGPLDHELVLLLLHTEVVVEYEAALMSHVLSADPSARLAAAQAATSASPHRRDPLHEQLLLSARRVPYALSLIYVVLGDQGLEDRDRVRWLTQHPHPKIRALFGYYLQHNPNPGGRSNGAPAPGTASASDRAPRGGGL